MRFSSVFLCLLALALAGCGSDVAVTKNQTPPELLPPPREVPAKDAPKGGEFTQAEIQAALQQLGAAARELGQNVLDNGRRMAAPVTQRIQNLVETLRKRFMSPPDVMPGADGEERPAPPMPQPPPLIKNPLPAPEQMPPADEDLGMEIERLIKNLKKQLHPQP